MAKKPTKSNLPKAKGKQPVPKNKTGGASTLAEGVELDDVILNFYDCANFGWIGLTDAEKEVLDNVGINDAVKKLAYAEVYKGGKDTASSATQFFCNSARRVNYLRFLMSKRVYDMETNIAPFVQRVTSAIHTSPSDLIDYLHGFKNIFDIPPHIMANLKVKGSCSPDGEIKSFDWAVPTLKETMEMLGMLESLDPVLASHFKTKLAPTAPKLNRSTPKED